MSQNAPLSTLIQRLSDSMICRFHWLFISSPFISHELINTHWYARRTLPLCWCLFSLPVYTFFSRTHIIRCVFALRKTLQFIMYSVWDETMEGSWVSHVLSVEHPHTVSLRLSLSSAAWTLPINHLFTFLNNTAWEKLPVFIYWENKTKAHVAPPRGRSVHKA